MTEKPRFFLIINRSNGYVVHKGSNPSNAEKAWAKCRINVNLSFYEYDKEKVESYHAKG